MILEHKKSTFFRAAFGVLLITALTLVGLTDAKPVTDPKPATNTTSQNASPETLPAASDTVQNPAMVVIRGRVIDENGQPVADATVRPGYIYTLREQPAIVKTDENGTFQFEWESKYVSPFLWFHAVTEDQTQLGNSRIKFNEGDACIPEMEITIKPTRVITGTVVDGDRNPVAGATVAGVDQTIHPNLVTTDAEGKFKCAYPPNQTRPLQQIVAFKENVGFDYLCTEEIDKYKGITPPEKINDGPFQLTLSPIKPVELRVVNEDGEPLAGIEVGAWLISKGRNDSFNTAYSPDFFDSRTNAEGIATLHCLPKWAKNQTRYTAYGPADGVLLKDGTRAFYGGDDKRMGEFEENRISPSNILGKIWGLTKDNEKIPSVIPTFVLPKQARVKGTVKLADGTPVPWARITRSNYAACGHGIRFTDANGEFELRENANQKLNLAVDESRFGATQGVFAFNVGDGRFEKTLDFVIEKGIRLHGTVYGLDGKPTDKEPSVSIYEKDPNPLICDLNDENCETCGTGESIVTRQTSNYGEKVLDGKYEYILPAAKREYRIRARLYGEEGVALHEFTLTGDETEYELDLHLTTEKELSE